MDRYQYLYIHCSIESKGIFPCNTEELKYVLKNASVVDILTKWPGHGHGREWRMEAVEKLPDIGVMVLDLHREIGRDIPLTVAELEDIGVWS